LEKFIAVKDKHPRVVVESKFDLPRQPFPETGRHWTSPFLFQIDLQPDVSEFLDCYFCRVLKIPPPFRPRSL